jgi:hypothetical protein
MVGLNCPEPSCSGTVLSSHRKYTLLRSHGNQQEGPHDSGPGEVFCLTTRPAAAFLVRGVTRA